MIISASGYWTFCNDNIRGDKEFMSKVAHHHRLHVSRRFCLASFRYDAELFDVAAKPGFCHNVVECADQIPVLGFFGTPECLEIGTTVALWIIPDNRVFLLQVFMLVELLRSLRSNIMRDESEAVNIRAFNVPPDVKYDLRREIAEAGHIAVLITRPSLIEEEAWILEHYSAMAEELTSVWVKPSQFLGTHA